MQRLILFAFFLCASVVNISAFVNGGWARKSYVYMSQDAGFSDLTSKALKKYETMNMVPDKNKVKAAPIERKIESSQDPSKTGEVVMKTETSQARSVAAADASFNAGSLIPVLAIPVLAFVMFGKKSPDVDAASSTPIPVLATPAPTPSDVDSMSNAASSEDDSSGVDDETPSDRE